MMALSMIGYFRVNKEDESYVTIVRNFLYKRSVSLYFLIIFILGMT